MNCPNCGRYNDNQSKFCINCGTPLNVLNNGITNSAINSAVNVNNKNKKRNIMIVLGIIIVILILLFVGYKLISQKNNNTYDSFNDNQLIPIKNNNKYGYINSEGKIVLEPIYKEANNFAGDYALVVSDINDGSVYQIIDKTGKVYFESQRSINYVDDYNVWVIEGALYDSNLKKISKDNIYVSELKDGYFLWEDKENNNTGLMNYKGDISYTYNYQNDENYLFIRVPTTDFSIKEKYCLVNIENEKYAIINCDNGKIIYNYTSNKIGSKDNNIFIMKDANYNFISSFYVQNDKILYQAQDENITISYDNNYLRIYNQNDYSYKYYDITNNNIIDRLPSDFDKDINEWEAFTGIYEKTCPEGVGLVKNNKEVIACEYSKFTYLNNLLYQYLSSQGKDYVLGIKNDKTYLINLKNGKVDSVFNSVRILTNEESTFVYYIDSSDNKKTIYNLITGKSLNTGVDNKIYLNPNYVIVKENNKNMYYNTNLKLIYTEEM